MASLSCWASLSKLGVGIQYFKNLGDVLLVPLQFACDSTLASLIVKYARDNVLSSHRWKWTNVHYIWLVFTLADQCCWSLSEASFTPELHLQIFVHQQKTACAPLMCYSSSPKGTLTIQASLHKWSVANGYSSL